MVSLKGLKTACYMTFVCFTGMDDHYSPGYRSHRHKIEVANLTLETRKWWFYRRIPIEVLRSTGVFLVVACVSSTWGLNSSMDTTLLGYMSFIFVTLDIIIFVEWWVAFYYDQHDFFQDQRVTYFYYSVFLGFPFGTITKVLWLLYDGGDNDIEESNIAVPYILLIVLLTILFLYFLAYEVKIECSLASYRAQGSNIQKRNYEIKCGVKAVLGILFVTFYWVSIGALLR